MDKGAKDKLVGSPGENEEDRMHKKIYPQELENWKGRDEEEDPGKDGEKK